TDSDNNTDTKVVTVVVNDGSYEVGTDYIVQAQSFTKKVSEVETTEGKVLEATQAKAWKVDSIDGATDVDATITDDGGYKAEEGVYTIVVAAKDETSVNRTVYGIVVPDDAHIEETEDYVIIASNATISSNKVAQLDAQKVINLTNAKAYNKNTGQLVDVAITGGNHGITEVKGDYPVTFEIVEKQTIQVTATVTVTETMLVLNANDVIVTYEDSIKELAKVNVSLGIARFIMPGTNDIKVNAVELALIQNGLETGGEYNLTFYVESEGITYSKTIKVTVLAKVVTPPTKPAPTVPEQDTISVETSAGSAVSTADGSGLEWMTLMFGISLSILTILTKYKRKGSIK
ncbi:MAG: hypothetical protein ACK5LC_10940, partial [Coprobacillaceae bacterium]